MKFSVSKEKLLAGLQTVQNVVSTRTTLPILSNVLLQAADGQLRLTTTDLDVGVSGAIEAQIEKAGATTLPARRLATIVRELPAARSAGRDRLEKRRLDPLRPELLQDPRPARGGVPAAAEASTTRRPSRFSQQELRDALKKTSYAISTDETRYVLNGILFSFKENKLTMVATDGRRLALVDLEVEFPRSQEADIIVPTKCVTELARLLGDEGDVKMSVGENQVAFEVDGTLLVSKLIEGNYPNYRQVIPGEAKERVTLERELFLNAVHRVSLLSSEKSNSVKLVFSKNNIEIAANTPGCRRSARVAARRLQRQEFSIAFNPEFLMAPLRNLPNDEVYLDLIDEMSPGVIKIQSPFLYVLMPMRIS